MILKTTKTTVICEAEKTTANATYKVTYTVIGSILQNITARVYESREVDISGPDGQVSKQSQIVEIGSLSMENSTMRSGMFPYSAKLPLYMTDFVGIVNEILTPEDTFPQVDQTA